MLPSLPKVVLRSFYRLLHEKLLVLGEGVTAQSIQPYDYGDTYHPWHAYRYQFDDGKKLNGDEDQPTEIPVYEAGVVVAAAAVVVVYVHR